MPARWDQLWQGLCWQGYAQVTSGRPCTSLVGGRGKQMDFLREQFQHEKMLPQRDFAAGRFFGPPRTSAGAQVPGNCSTIISSVIPLIRTPGAY